MRTLRNGVMLLAVLLVVAPRPALADGSCVDVLRTAFEPVASQVKKVQDAVNRFANRKGRAQAAAVEKILSDKFAEAKKQAVNGDEDKAWDDFVKKWEKDVTDRMTDNDPKTYPGVEEMLALMAAKSPTFRAGLLEFLSDHGTIRFKVLAHFMEDVPGKGGKVKFGDEFFSLWKKKISLPARQTWTPDEFALFMTEISNALFRSTHPEPGFANAWLKAFGEVKISDPATWKVWQKFADRFTVEYRARYTEFLNGVTSDAYGKVRPDVIADFYRWGIWDTVYRHLAAFKVGLSESGGKMIEQGTGLKLEDIDELNNDPLYSKLPRSVKNAIILARNPALYKAMLLDQEVEQLALEVMWATRPVIEAMILYNSVIDPAILAYRLKTARDKMVDDVQKHPDKYLPNTKQADDDRIKNFDEQIADFKAEKKKLTSELANPGLTSDEQAQRQKAIARLDKKINNLENLKADLLKGVQTGSK